MYIYSKTLFHIFRITGILPVSQRSLPFKRKLIRYSKFWIFYSFIVLLFLLTVCLTRLHLYFNRIQHVKFTERKTIDSIIAISSANSSQICSFLCLAMVIINIKSKIFILEEIKDIDFLLRIKSPLRRRRDISYILIIHTVTTCAYIASASSHELSFMILTAINQLCKVVNVCFSVEFMELVLSTRDRLRFVKKKIVEVVTMNESKPMFTTALPFIEIPVLPKQKQLELSVEELNKIHWNICKVVHEICRTYGLAVIFLITTFFIQFVYNIYSIFFQISEDGNYSILTVIVPTNNFLSYLFHLYTLVWPCTLTVSEYDNTLPVIIQLMARNEKHPTFHHLEVFANQLLQRRLEFSAYGLFTLQASVVISIVSAVTNYMAIVVQLQSSAGK